MLLKFCNSGNIGGGEARNPLISKSSLDSISNHLSKALSHKLFYFAETKPTFILMHCFDFYSNFVPYMSVLWLD